MVSVEGKSWECETCGRPNSANFSFCTECGQPSSKNGWICPGCKTSIPYGDYKYCTKCGARRETRESARPTSSTEKEIESRVAKKRSKPRKIDEKPVASILCPRGYILTERIGSGGFSDVYKARNPDGQIVALKFPRIDPGKTVPESVFEQFKREAVTWRTLKHPHIVEVYDYGLKPLPWISIELMEGGSLMEKLENGPLPTEEALTIAVKIASALEYADHHGAVHRDVNPRNILFTAEGVPKLTDWGLVKRLLEASSGENFKGTLACCAPEQLDSANYGKVDWRTDVYCLGVVIYWMLTGENPFRGEAEDIRGYIRRIVEQDVKPLCEINRSVPSEIDGIVVKTLAKRKEDRYESVILLRKDLEKLLQSQKASKSA